MASLMVIKCVAFLGLLISLFGAMVAEGAITCSQATGDIGACLNYLTDRSSTTIPPSNCCQGVRTVYASATTPADRTAVCQCLKNAAAAITNLDVARADALPENCGVHLGFPISPNIDCNSVGV